LSFSDPTGVLGGKNSMEIGNGAPAIQTSLRSAHQAPHHPS